MRTTKAVKTERMTKCPLCNGELYAYSLMGISRAESCYCPWCDIVRQCMISVPFLCSKCYSRSFYEKDGDHYCWFCGNNEIIGIKYEEAEKRGLFDTEGFKLSGTFVDRKDNGCKHENNINRRHNKTVFKFTCSHCGDVEYVMIPEWLQKEQNITDQIV